MGSCASVISRKPSSSGLTPQEKYHKKRNSITQHNQDLVQQFTELAQTTVKEREKNNLGILSTRNNTFKIGRAHDSLQALSLNTKLRSIEPKDMSDTQHLYDVLKKHWIFRETDDEALFNIIENIYNIKVTKNTEIITQGDEGDAFYILASGECHVLVDGVKKDYHMEKDATFGELALFFNCARTATVVATTDCVLWKMESIAMKISIMQYHENVERKNVDFLEKLPELQPYKGSNNIKRLAQILAPMVFSDGDEIITEGDAGNIFYILEEGECKVIVGRKVKEEKLQPGQWFGEAALIMDAPRSASVVAVGECKCLALEKHNFVEVLSPFEEFSKSIRESPYVKRVASKMKQVLHTPMDRYEFISILGVGGFGVISLQRDKGKKYLEDMNDPEKQTQEYLKAQRSDINNLVAIKEMKKQLIVMRNMQRAIGRELEYLTSIVSPFVLDVFATSRDAHSIYIMTEFLPGGDFFDYLASKRKLDEKTHTKFYVASILFALQASHKQYIIYRDLKLENFVIDSKGYIKMVDFGLAKRVLNRTFTVCGTPRYCSPEMLTGTGHNQSTDFWSLGVFMYECLYGASPFNDNCSDLELFRRVTQGKFKIRDNVPITPECLSMLNGLLTKKPRNRLGGNGLNAAGNILKHDWFKDFDLEALKNQEMIAPDGVPEPFDLATHNFINFDTSMHKQMNNYNPNTDRFKGWDEVF